MLEIKEEELDKILPSDGPSIDEVKRYLEKYNDEYIVIKCGGSVLVDQDLFEIFIKDITTLNKLGFIPIIVHGGGKRISNKLSELGADTIVVSESSIDFSKNVPSQVCNLLFNKGINSVIIEGGSKTLQTFINANLWDEARVFIGNLNFINGIKAPFFKGKLISEKNLKGDLLKTYKND